MPSFDRCRLHQVDVLGPSTPQLREAYPQNSKSWGESRPGFLSLLDSVLVHGELAFSGKKPGGKYGLRHEKCPDKCSDVRHDLADEEQTAVKTRKGILYCAHDLNIIGYE